MSAYTSIAAEEEHSASALLYPEYEGSARTEKLLDHYFPEDHKEIHPINKRFTDFMLAVIVLQTMTLGVQIQWKAEDSAFLGYVYEASSVFFLAAYLIEVVLKVRAKGWSEYLFTGEDYHWNTLDFVLTMTMLFQMILESTFPELLHHNLEKTFDVIRTMRMLRVIHVLRRVRELSIVLGGVTGSFGALLWIFFLLALLVYAFAVLFTVAIGVDVELFEDPKFGSVPNSMITLTDMVMGGTWGDVLNPVIAKRVYMLPFFFLFITISSFGLLNLVVGVICDATADTRKRLEFETNRQKLWTISEQYRVRLESLHLDKRSLSSTRGVSLQEKQDQRKETIIQLLQDMLDDPSNPVVFPAGSQAKDLFEMLDPEAKNTLDHKDFVTGMGKLLLGTSFELNCMGLINQGRTRRILRNQEVRRDARFDSLGARFDKLEHRLDDSLDARFDKLEQRLDKFEDRFGNIENRFGNIENRFGNVEQQLATIVAKLK